MPGVLGALRSTRKSGGSPAQMRPLSLLLQCWDPAAAGPAGRQHQRSTNPSPATSRPACPAPKAGVAREVGTDRWMSRRARPDEVTRRSGDEGRGPRWTDDGQTPTASGAPARGPGARKGPWAAPHWGPRHVHCGPPRRPGASGGHSLPGASRGRGRPSDRLTRARAGQHQMLAPRPPCVSGPRSAHSTWLRPSLFPNSPRGDQTGHTVAHPAW